jgi:putative Ca2+/H+ antiporter (TMEM165/GDT1 family)
MIFDFSAFLFAAGAVVLAEMGDKTQLLAMAFATKYKASKVMIGVLIATVLNHALAVLVGNLIAQIGGAQVLIQGISSLAFIFFGLWTIRGDKLDGEDKKKTKFGPVATVTLAFFMAEMSDKTQLATVALATKFPASPFGILMGTTAGMLIADGVGIIIGVVLCRKIPERIVKLISAGVFIAFGFIGCWEVISGELNLETSVIILIMTVLAAITGVAAYLIIKKNKNDKSADEEIACLRKTDVKNLE